MTLTITRANPLKFPNEILEQIFQDDTGMLVTCMLLNKEWYMRMRTLCHTFRKIMVKVPGTSSSKEEPWKKGILHFISPTLVSVAVKAEQQGIWSLLSFFEQHHEQGRIRTLDIITLPSDDLDSNRFDLSDLSVTFSTVCGNLTSLSIQTGECPTIHGLLHLCPNLVILDCKLDDGTTNRDEDALQYHTSLRMLQISQQSRITKQPDKYLPYLPQLQVLRIINDSTSYSDSTYHLNDVLAYAMTRTPNIKTFYVGKHRMKTRKLATLLHNNNGDRSGLQDIDLDKRVKFAEQHFVSFFRVACQTLTRLRFEKPEYIRILGREWEHPFIHLRELRLECSNGSSSFYAVDIGRFLSYVPNIVKLWILNIRECMVTIIAPAIGRLHRLNELRIDCRRCGSAPDITSFGHLASIKSIEVANTKVTGFDPFLENLTRSGGHETLQFLKLEFKRTNHKPQETMETLVKTCARLKYAQLKSSKYTAVHCLD
ncbi:hypothetical protein BCR43DRAFT_498783 [Syncephalastrum racemosum]|uniref:F-box domain-containing protein n=1 Tax=Syncephalastrum racemosum TaxID=13706 RepID=A0A1X2H1G2_SYNRA|nr:hypothetical protein BCR43DRAFT_498783 [Syncephalastrum racemosum]